MPAAERVQAWLDAYIEAWRTYDRAAIGELFGADATHAYSGKLISPTVGESLAIIAFAITWGCMSVIQVLSRFAPRPANRPN